MLALLVGYANSGLAQLALEKVQADIHRSLDVSVALDGMEQKVYFASLTAHTTPPIYYLGHASLAGGPELHLHHFVDDPVEHGNPAHYHNDRYEKLFDQIQQTPNGKPREDLVHQALHILQVEDVVVIPLTERRQFFAVSPKLHGFQVNPASEIELRHLRLSQ